MGKALARLTFPRRGEIYVVRFDPTVGAEIRKARPALVIQNDVGNRVSPLTIVAAISSRRDPGRVYPTDVPVSKGEGGLAAESAVLTNQIRSVDKQRLGKRLGRLKPATMGQVDQALLVSLGLIEL